MSTTVDYFASKEISFFHKITHEGYLRHLLVRGAAKTGEILVCLVTTSQLSMDLTEYRDLLLAGEYEGKIAGILHMVNDGLSDVVRADSTEVLYGRDYFYEDILGLKFKISPFLFSRPILSVQKCCMKKPASTSGMWRARWSSIFIVAQAP